MLLQARIVRAAQKWLVSSGVRTIVQSAQAEGPQPGGYLGTGKLWPKHTEESSHRFLVTGAAGQVGTELIPFIREKVGVDSVVASDVKTSRTMLESGPFVYLDVTDRDNLARVICEHGITHVVHLATLLSAVGERNPQLALKINTSGIQNVLDMATQHNLQVFSPSTIAVFGATSPKVMTPDDCVMQPNTMYGITKVHAELLGQYYRDRFGVDYRSLRYPGIISSKAPPGGGTTDYAVDIFYQALKAGSYTCFLHDDATLPMMYMPDCLEATWQIMTAPRDSLTRTTYNVTSMSFSPAQLADAIRAHIPHFQVTYTPDFRDSIASTWPRSLDDSLARRDWGWAPRYDLAAMTKDMLEKLAQRLAQQQAQQAQAQQAQAQQAQAQQAQAQQAQAQQAQRKHKQAPLPQHHSQHQQPDFAQQQSQTPPPQQQSQQRDALLNGHWAPGGLAGSACSSASGTGGISPLAAAGVGAGPAAAV